MKTVNRIFDHLTKSAGVILILSVAISFTLAFTDPRPLRASLGMETVTTNAVNSEDLIPEYLQSISVKIIVGDGTGSGIAFTRKDSNGKPITFIWTAAHIFTHHDGDFFSLLLSTNRPNVPTQYADIQQVTVKNGVVVGKKTKSVKMFKFSDDENGEDLAILRVNGEFFNTNTVVFDLTGDVPHIGQSLYSMGAPYGLAQSFSPGYYSFIGRNFEGMIFDQTTCVIFPGSSGGGIFSVDGKYEGMSNVMRASSINFITPIRRIQKWVEREHIEWTLDPTCPMPSEKELKKISLYDTALTPKVELKE